MIKTKAYGLVSTITLAGALGLMTTPSVEAAEIKTGLQTTPIRRAALDSLSDEQESHVIPGQITDVPMSWINSETGNVEWITDFVLVYEKTGKCSAIPSDEIQIPETPSSDTPVPPSSGTPGNPGSDTPKTPSSLTPSNPIQKVIQKVLPNTGVKQATTLIVVGVGLATFAGYLMFRNKRTGKTVAVALLVATGAGFSSAALAESVGFLDIVQQIEIKLDERFQHTAEESECWKYVGYIPVIAEESVKESDKTGNVNVKYVDTEGKEIKALYKLVENGLVSTTKTTTTTVDGVSSSTEETVESKLEYDATTQKPTTITFDGKVYEFVQVKDGDVEQGLVKEGTTTVTYIYRHVPQITESVTETPTTGNVDVKYVDTEGKEIKVPYNLVVDGLVSTTKTTTTTVDGVSSSTEETVASGLTYDATTQKPTTITFEGKVYEFVQVKDGDVEKDLVKEGTTTVTYIYRHVPQITESVTETTKTGNVNVKYVDTEGKEIKDLYNLVVEGKVSTTRTTTTTVDGVSSSTEETVASELKYDATTQKPTTITFEGKVYEFVQVKDGDVEQGLVKEGTTTVTYIYRHVPQVTTDVQTSTATGSVTVHYVDTEGNEIQGAVDLVTDGVVSTTTTTTTTTDGVASVTEDTVASGLSYDATTQKPTSITSNGKVYELVQVKDGDVEKGLVKKGTTTITYIYRHVPQVTTDVQTSTATGSVTVHYVDTEGNEIQGAVDLVTDGVVSTTTTTTTTTDGVASVTEDTVASGLSYDATTQKPTSITSNGKVYELVQVKDGDVEKGLVKKGTTTVTYIYKVAPNTTETISTPVTGTVKTRYIDADTGEEIVSGSTIVDNGIVANKVTTIVRNAAGEVVSETTKRVPTGLTYDTTDDKTAKNAEIALLRIPVLEMIDYNGKLVTPDANGYVTVTETKTFSGAALTSSDYQSVYTYVENHYKRNLNPTYLSIKSLDIIPVGSEFAYSTVVEYTYYIGNKTVGYTFVGVEGAEQGAVEEGDEMIITYKYRRQAYEAEATTAVAMTIKPAEMTTSLPD
ncbi:LPXTG cell wall anchor domain-containing protein [Streptococcus suis]|uniref:LPXTG cell wall anchor domain-containing protein n=1 Tax=Streptococcus suis TaxID=1307 RepID=UPI00211D27AA|nr:LPXTG cell wall anchor domain-containing protein [Streptococcus suis]UUM58377.1 LPXTG cell wall anchor domain-containing protein [Streptococcus suis]